MSFRKPWQQTMGRDREGSLDTLKSHPEPFIFLFERAITNSPDAKASTHDGVNRITNDHSFLLPFPPATPPRPFSSSLFVVGVRNETLLFFFFAFFVPSQQLVRRGWLEECARKDPQLDAFWGRSSCTIRWRALSLFNDHRECYGLPARHEQV